MSTKKHIPFSNQFERGHSFNWANKWEPGKYYFNDDYVTDFISYGSCILACRRSHESTEDNKPVIVFDTSNNTPVDVEGPLWSFVTSTMNGDIFRFVTMLQYQELERTGSVEPNVLYFIYDRNE